MRKIIIISTLLLLIPFCLKSLGIPIVNNSGSSSEDTLTFNILNLLPSGNPAYKLDSAYFTVFKSNTNDIIFRDSSTGVSMTGVDSFVIGGDVAYYFHRAVADIDGAGAVGTYSYNLVSVFDDSSMRTPTLGQFQIVGWELDDIGDSTGLAADGVDKSLDSLHLMIDSLMAILDTLQNQDNWISAFNSTTDKVTPTDTTSSGQGLLTYSGGADSTFLLKRFAISGANSTSGSFYVENSSINSAAVLFNAMGAGTASVGLFAEGGSGFGIYAKGTNVDIGLGGSGTIENISGDIVLMDNNVIYADTIANRILEDSSSYQNFDSAQVASTIWNTPQNNHTMAGTFGKYLDTEISGLSSGGGGYSYQLVVIDSGISQVVPGASLAIRNLNQSALIAVGTTNLLGVASFNLNAASYVAIASSPGYIFENFDTVVVAGAEVDSVYGYQFDPGTPADPGLCRVYGYLYDIEGNPEDEGTIAAWLPSGASRLGSTIVSPFRKETSTDDSGYFYIDLIPSVDLTPTTSKYEITITLSDGTVLRERLLVPDLSSWMLTW